MALTAVVSLPRRMADYLEFSNTRHFAAWAVLCGALAAFSLVHLRFINFHGTFCRDGGLVPGEGALPGECFYFLRWPPAQIGIMAHLALILPAALLVCSQFVPRIRHRAIRVHRIVGRMSLVMALIGTLGVIPTVRHAFGGDIAAQVVGYLEILMFIGTQLTSYWHIKHQHIEQHRAWMLRSWSYVGHYSKINSISHCYLHTATVSPPFRSM
jgi:cytochrome bd-type quinol oxidase subunit 2